MTNATELRFTVPDYIHAPSGSGFGDLSVGVKQQMGHTSNGLDFSLIAFLSFPTGQSGVSSHRCELSLHYYMVAEDFRKLDRGGNVVVILARSPAPEI